jgi:phosphate-selective porin
MLASSTNPAVVVAALILAVPAWAQDAQPTPAAITGSRLVAAEPAAAAATAEAPAAAAALALSAQEPKKPKKAQKKAKAPDETGTTNGFVWADRPSLRFGNQFQMDFRLKLQADFRQSDLDLSSRGGTFEWGRRRAGIKGSFLKYFEYEAEHDLYTNGQWRDTYLNFRYDASAQVQGGKFKIPFGYEQLTNPMDLDLVYRTRASDALTPGRSIGAMVHGRPFKRVIRYQAGYFKDDGDNPPHLDPPPLLPGEQPPSQQGSWAARVTFAPLRLGSLPGHLNDLEIGGAFVSTTIPEGRNNLNAEMVLGDKFFHSRYYTNGRRLRAGLEMSWAPGPFSVSAEYLRTTEARKGVGVGNEQVLDNTLPDIQGRGWYVTGSWVITGERKGGGVKPRHPLLQGGFGAIEVAARYEVLRFASAGPQQEPPSDSFRAANVVGNGDRVFTGGVNWYLNRWLKFQVNGIHETLDDATLAPVPGQSSYWTVVTRLQFVL